MSVIFMIDTRGGGRGAVDFGECHRTFPRIPSEYFEI